MKLANDFFFLTEMQRSDASFMASIRLNPQHPVFAAHFPGYPVTPGVIQMKIMHELLEIALEKEIHLDSISDCKFLNIINPEKTPRLDVRLDWCLRDDRLSVRSKLLSGQLLFFKMSSEYRPVAIRTYLSSYNTKE